jgi:anti-sigma factor RsiW
MADGELSAEKASELRQRLSEDAESQAAFEGIVALKQCLASRSLRHECRAEWQGCVQRIRELENSRKVEKAVGKYAWALCGLFFLVILGAGITQRGTSRVGSEEVVQAATTLMPTRTPPTKDAQALDAYVDALLGEASRSLAPDRLQLLAGAVGEINGHRAARLTLRDGSGDMALIVIADDLSFDGMSTMAGSPMNIRYGNADGLSMVAWHVDDGSAILLGDRSHAELADLAQRISIR